MFKLNDLFKKDLLLELVVDCEGLIDIIEEENYIEAYDEQEDMILHFHHNVDFENLFDFGSLNVNKEKFFNIVKGSLEKVLFLMPDKIYFISTEYELDKLEEEYSSQSLDFNNVLGINWLYDSVIVINISQCRIVAKEVSEDTGDSFEDTFNEAVWTTLIHELRHMVCDLGLVIPNELIPISEGSEEKVEEYGNNCFWNNIYYEDYKCFN